MCEYVEFFIAYLIRYKGIKTRTITTTTRKVIKKTLKQWLEWWKTIQKKKRQKDRDLKIVLSLLKFFKIFTKLAENISNTANILPF